MPAMSSARQLKAAATRTDGLAVTDCARAAGRAVPCWIGLGRPALGWPLLAERDGAGGCRAPTSVPTGPTLPSTAKPQFSRLLPALISVSAGQCSRVTISVTPCRLAIPTEVAPAALVQPIFPPMAPG